MPYAELLEFNQPSPIRKEGYTKIRDQYDLEVQRNFPDDGNMDAGTWEDYTYYLDPERIVEFAGRADYGPKNTAKLGSDETIISRWIDAGHHSMLEFASATFYIECTRVVSHELVRHRLASFQQESQRYVKYDDEDAESIFFYPPEIEDVDGIWKISPETWERAEVPGTGDDGMPAYDAYLGLYDHALELYKQLRAAGVKAQIARYVLPNAMKTRVIMKANLREWRHIISLRTSAAAQPEMRELAEQIYEQLVDVFPHIMYNVKEQETVR